MGFQVGSEDLLNIAVTLKFQLYKHKDLLRGIITPSQKKAVAAFVQAPGDYFDADPTFKQSYAPQSARPRGQPTSGLTYLPGRECLEEADSVLRTALAAGPARSSASSSR